MDQFIYSATLPGLFVIESRAPVTLANLRRSVLPFVSPTTEKLFKWTALRPNFVAPDGRFFPLVHVGGPAVPS
jgi:hypothetical protein